MASHRTRRIADLLRVIVSELLTRETQDPRLAHVRITEVRVSSDLSHATFFFSLFPGAEPDRQAALEAFTRAGGWIRREIAARGGLRVVPQIRFLSDRALEHAAHIDEVLREVLPAATDAGPGADAGAPQEPDGEPDADTTPATDEEPGGGD